MTDTVVSYWCPALFAGIAVTVWGPYAIRINRWAVMHPRTTMTLWFAIITLGISLTVSAVSTCTLIATGIISSTTTLHNIAATIVAWSTCLACGAILAHTHSHASPLMQHRLAALTCTAPSTASEAQQPAAHIAITGHLTVSRSLRELLTPEQIDAVVAHEKAHMVQRHHSIVLLAAAYSHLLFSKGAGPYVHRGTRILVELAADDAAAREHHATHLAAALTQVASATNNQACELRAARLRP
ncbi:M48 family metalloprotease [Jonesia quinghaiensis]|uniref:M48 family metalloprotease n=1 Tax=Jonesia quinghaiensis TaxID=262806 RepID=UPI0004915F20|nr:M48 family metalloprotease [Jonesia quinghaiensis]